MATYSQPISCSDKSICTFAPMASLKHVTIVAATAQELEAVRAICSASRFPKLDLTWSVLGIGMVNTAISLTQLVLKNPETDLCINVGIAGSFGPDFLVGDVVQVQQDQIAWFGAEDQDSFLMVEHMGLVAELEVLFPATTVSIHLPMAKAITVNAAHGKAASIARVLQCYAPQVESMEGAAFFQVCKHFGLQAMQVRAISNKVEPRNRDAWNIPLALNNLAEKMLLVLQELNDGN